MAKWGEALNAGKLLEMVEGKISTTSVIEHKQKSLEEIRASFERIREEPGLSRKVIADLPEKQARGGSPWEAQLTKDLVWSTLKGLAKFQNCEGPRIDQPSFNSLILFYVNPIFGYILLGQLALDP